MAYPPDDAIKTLLKAGRTVQEDQVDSDQSCLLSLPNRFLQCKGEYGLLVGC